MKRNKSYKREHGRTRPKPMSRRDKMPPKRLSIIHGKIGVFVYSVCLSWSSNDY